LRSACVTDQPIDYLWTGVHLFFVLSGFLLFLPYARWIQSGRDRHSALLQAALPAYRSRLLDESCDPLTRRTEDRWLVPGYAGPHAVFLQNLSQKTIYSINGVFWTIAVEAQFYAVLPLLAWALYLLARRVGPWVALAIFVPALAGNALIYNVALRPEALTYWINIFGFGIACALIYVAMQRNEQVLSFLKGRWSRWSVERAATWTFTLTFIPFPAFDAVERYRLRPDLCAGAIGHPVRESAHPSPARVAACAFCRPDLL
jgi:peptidoglycan/LPS O-acetylase OafA/YrhL